jgi:HicA toxin of bacterial toxin-antitoxin,
VTREEKLIKRLLTRPKDFSWDELVTLLSRVGFEESSSGKTGGSRRRFVNTQGIIISLHKPHPRNILKTYQIEQIIEILKEEGYL